MQRIDRGQRARFDWRDYARALIGDATDALLQSRNTTAEYLRDSRPEFRRAALGLLAHVWPRGNDIKTVCEEMAISDPSEVVRADAVGFLGDCYSRTNDRQAGKAVADIVRDEKERANVRRSAYYALFKIRGKYILSWPNPETFRFPEEVDWAFVESFLSGTENASDVQDDPLGRPGSALPPELRAAAAAHVAAMAAFDKQEFEHAIELFTESIRNVPQSPLSLCMRGCAYGNLGDLDAAIADFSKAIALKPRDPLAYRERSVAFHLLGRDKLAKVDAEIAERLEESRGAT